jgi:hypothetical protein
MKALISAVALLAFIGGSMLPTETYAQTMGTGQTVAPDTSTPAAPTATKKKKSSKAHHAKKKSKKSTAQTSSAKSKHARHSVS